MAKSTRTQEALALAEETLQALELGLPSLLPIVLRGARLARLLENTDAENWLSLELRGYNAPLGIANWSGYAIWSGREGTKNPDGQQMYYIAPVEQIELELEIARSDLNSLQLTPIALTDSAFADKQWAIQSAAEKCSTQFDPLANRRPRRFANTHT